MVVGPPPSPSSSVFGRSEDHFDYDQEDTNLEDERPFIGLKEAVGFMEVYHRTTYTALKELQKLEDQLKFPVTMSNLRMKECHAKYYFEFVRHQLVSYMDQFQGIKLQ